MGTTLWLFLVSLVTVAEQEGFFGGQGREGGGGGVVRLGGGGGCTTAWGAAHAASPSLSVTPFLSLSFSLYLLLLLHLSSLPSSSFYLPAGASGGAHWRGRGSWAVGRVWNSLCWKQIRLGHGLLPPWFRRYLVVIVNISFFFWKKRQVEFELIIYVWIFFLTSVTKIYTIKVKKIITHQIPNSHQWKVRLNSGYQSLSFHLQLRKVLYIWLTMSLFHFFMSLFSTHHFYGIVEPSS